MPRSARKISQSGYYHIVLRGNGKQLLFESDAARLTFLELLQENCQEKSIAIIAWCLMDNHVHLLLCDISGNLSGALQSIETSYAQYFNLTTGHVGHVFEGRFKSMPVEDDVYLLDAVRYIHNNPVRAGIAPVDRYWWSSYHEYVGKASLIDPKPVLEEFGDIEGFVAFHQSDEKSYYTFAPGRRIPDEMAGDIAQCITDRCFSCALDEVKGLPRSVRNECLQVLRERRLTVRQIQRLTGIGEKTIQRATSA